MHHFRTTQHVHRHEDNEQPKKEKKKKKSIEDFLVASLITIQQANNSLSTVLAHIKF